jgi:hypothetical protein
MVAALKSTLMWIDYRENPDHSNLPSEAPTRRPSDPRRGWGKIAPQLPVPSRHRIPAGAGAVAGAGDRVGHGGRGI